MRIDTSISVLICLGVTRRRFSDDVSVLYYTVRKHFLAEAPSPMPARREIRGVCELNYSKTGREIITATQWTEPGSGSVVWAGFK